jgi:hypothetical protein
MGTACLPCVSMRLGIDSRMNHHTTSPETPRSPRVSSTRPYGVASEAGKAALLDALPVAWQHIQEGRRLDTDVLRYAGGTLLAVQSSQHPMTARLVEFSQTGVKALDHIIASAHGGDPTATEEQGGLTLKVALDKAAAVLGPQRIDQHESDKAAASSLLAPFERVIDQHPYSRGERREMIDGYLSIHKHLRLEQGYVRAVNASDGHRHTPYLLEIPTPEKREWQLAMDNVVPRARTHRQSSLYRAVVEVQRYDIGAIFDRAKELVSGQG